MSQDTQYRLESTFLTPEEPARQNKQFSIALAVIGRAMQVAYLKHVHDGIPADCPERQQLSFAIGNL
ncbi:hypothetical protein [Candidatus Magnetaquicoccus inordinatus]|uniref:hypothetical protein n=1 Tax=Candidatus Magnetaquicoccus inordinatus TaxID=2496818 RepID=UPI00102B1E7F|nr:hypothetical protein [Candidatus Magnetaquicoccus inordinatus]